MVNISTIEDPIEYTIPRVTQIQTQPEIDLTFASGLRALLGQDPILDVISDAGLVKLPSSVPHTHFFGN